MTNNKHKAGFVNIIGRPNVGKSTLMNALVGEKMSIITNKPQTTRHRIVGIINAENFQIVFSDTPGYIKKPSYKMQESMNKFVHGSFEDADIILFVIDPRDTFEEDDPFLEKMKKSTAPIFLVINKMDLLTAEELEKVEAWWKEHLTFEQVFHISALNKKNTTVLLDEIIGSIPFSEPYYPKDQLTDRPERFFVAEIIREKILLLYGQEIPYSCEVYVQSFKVTKTKHGADITNIAAEIFVSRKTQKPIIIGKNGDSIKRLGTEARKTLEEWLEQKVFLELHVKVKENWRDDHSLLKNFGYED